MFLTGKMAKNTQMEQVEKPLTATFRLPKPWDFDFGSLLFSAAYTSKKYCGGSLGPGFGYSQAPAMVFMTFLKLFLTMP